MVEPAALFKSLDSVVQKLVKKVSKNVKTFLIFLIGFISRTDKLFIFYCRK